MQFKKLFVDLHIHTNFSDSTFSPQKVVDYACGCGLSAIAITDHDCVSGIPIAIEAAQGKHLEIVAGIELSCEFNGVEVHILGLFIDFNNICFLEELDRLKRDRDIRIKKIVRKLNAAGIKIEEQDVFGLTNPLGVAGRLHIAMAMLKKKTVTSFYEAFSRYIGNGKFCYVKKTEFSPFQAIEMIKSVGGRAFLAHPGLMRHDEFIPFFVEQGMDGIEVFHSQHSHTLAKHYINIAKQHNLLISGGSDCHGMGKNKPLMGKVKVPYKIFSDLRDALKK
ncbi:MAG: hypothetical protein DRP78_01450 [Candidatus Omnitrophota bacterium]|nr:MAG: hypothetical protein DRP78_01450 [Candidatus Omnitrophota bacterium]